VKRKKGDGLVRERSDGKWEARLTVNGRSKSFYGSSEREVKKKLKEFKSKLAGGIIQHKSMTFIEFAELWLERKRLEVKEQSYFRLLDTVRVHIEPIIGFYMIDKVDANLIQEELINKKCKLLSYSSVKKIYDSLNAYYKYARSMGYVSTNPVDLVLMPQKTNRIFEKYSNEQTSNLEVLSNDEVQRLVKIANTKYSSGKDVFPNGKIFVLMLYTGLRRGEACALKWSNFDETQGTLSISSTIIETRDDAGKTLYREQSSTKS